MTIFLRALLTKADKKKDKMQGGGSTGGGRRRGWSSWLARGHALPTREYLSAKTAEISPDFNNNYPTPKVPKSHMSIPAVQFCDVVVDKQLGDDVVIPAVGRCDLSVMTTSKKPCNTRYEQQVTDARLYAKQSKCVFDRDWPSIFFGLLDSNFPGIPFARIVRPNLETETTEVQFPPDFPCAPPSGKTLGYVACRAVLRALVVQHMYAWKGDLCTPL